MTYPGGKGAAGVYQQIINQIPPHDTYFEIFAGGASIYRKKKRAQKSYLVDLDVDAVLALQGLYDDDPNLIIFPECGMVFAESDIEQRTQYQNARTFIYADPPYVMDSRKSQRPIYRHEWADDDHREFLQWARRMPCSIAISGYASDLYFEELADWRVITFTGQTRQGPATEYLWMNYPEPVALHDCSYLGDNFRERENIKKMCRRWANNFDNMPPKVRQAVLSAMLERVGSTNALMGDGGIAPRQIGRGLPEHTAASGGTRSPDKAVTAAHQDPIARYGGARGHLVSAPEQAVPAGAKSFDQEISADWPRGQHG